MDKILSQSKNKEMYNSNRARYLVTVTAAIIIFAVVIVSWEL